MSELKTIFIIWQGLKSITPEAQVTWVGSQQLF